MAKRPYLPRDEYAWTYYESQKQARLFFLPFNEFERLADNDVREDLPPNMPKVNDGSLSDLLDKTTERVLGQMFTGTVKILESIDPETGKPTMPQPWLRELANFVWTKKIIPRANTQSTFFRKMQIAFRRALIYGSCPTYSFYTSNGNYHGADFTVPYIRDVYLEVGKSSDLDSDYIMMDTYYTRLQLARVIAQANRLEEIGVKSPWNIPELQRIYNSHVESQKDYLAKNKAERNRPVRSNQIKFTTIFQRGVEAPFDTFWTGGSGSSLEQALIVRSKINEDPTGDIPIHFLYAYDDLVNPYGTGQIKKSGGTQNVLDYLTQLHVLATQLGLQPPVLIEGDTDSTDTKSMIYAPSQFWFTGGAKVDLMETSNSIYKEFPQSYGLYKSNLVNAQGQAPVDVSGESGNPIASKTPTAQKQRANTLSEFDNHHRTQVFNTFGRVARSMLNIHFANMQGEDLERLETADAAKLTRAGLIPADPQNPDMPSTNEITIVWDNLRGKFDLEIDPDSVIYRDNQEQITQLSTILDLIQQNPYLIQYIQSTGYKLNVGEVYRQIFTKLGLQDVEKILEPLSEQDKAQAQSTPPMVFDKPHIDLKYSDVPPQAQMQLLQKLGLQVSLMDVLMGPVLDPNIRGVFQPQPQPGNANNPINPEPTLTQENQGAPIPPQPDFDQVMLPKGASFIPNPNDPDLQNPQLQAPAPAPQAPNPESMALLQQTMAEHGLPQHQAMAVMHAKANGIPDEEIRSYLINRKLGKYGAPQPKKGKVAKRAT